MASTPFLRPYQLVNADLFHPCNQIVPQDYFRPLDNIFKPLKHLLRQMEQLSSAVDNLSLKNSSEVSSDYNQFQINVDVQHFAPEEISVTVVDGYITVVGKHEEVRDEHGYISRQFVRRYPLPQGCLPDTVESKLSYDGVLTVTAPKVLPLPSTGERIVPIIKTGPVKKQIREGNLI